MLEQQPPSLQQRVQQLAQAAIAQADPTAWFEPLYAAAQGDAEQVPWARSGAHPQVQDWLDQHGGAGAGRAALVSGCGLGDDAEALAARGFSVTAFDIAPTAIAWCRERFPNSSVAYQVGDLLHPKPEWLGTFDVVVECRNLQALPLDVRSEAIASVASLVAPSGTLVVVTRLRDADGSEPSQSSQSPQPSPPKPTAPDGPPWPLSEQELAEFGAAGLTERQRQGVELPVSELPGAAVIRQAWIEYRAA